MFKKYTITPVVFGIHSAKYKFYIKKVPKLFTPWCNYWEIILYK